jgi:hypothetical protein
MTFFGWVQVGLLVLMFWTGIKSRKEADSPYSRVGLDRALFIIALLIIGTLTIGTGSLF